MSHSPRIVVIGSANTDLVVSVPHIPAPGETILGGDITTIPGGKGANQAVASARLGGSVTFIARVGDDAYGASVVANCKHEGIDTGYIRQTAGVPSGVALITVDQLTGQNAIVVAPGANASLSPADIERSESAFASAEIVVASLEVPLEAVLQAAQMAEVYRIPFVLNPAPARSLPPALLALTAYLVPNETEAMQILTAAGIAVSSNPDARELATLLRTLGIENVVVTVGKDGAVVATDEGVWSVASYPVTAVDTVAAGDTFTGALAVRIACGDPLLQAVGYANAAAALKVTRHGAQPGIPTAAELHAMLHEQGLASVR